MRAALVTGGNRGIGLAIVKAFKQHGIAVAVVGKSADRPDCDAYIQGDITSQPRSIVDSAVRTFDGIDILVNNAGAQVFHDAASFPDLKWQEQLDLMLTAPFHMMQEAANVWMLEHGGHIVNILSVGAMMASRRNVAYVAAKHGLLGVTRACAVEWAPKIHVNAVAPGLTETPMIDYIDAERRKCLEDITPSGRFSTPEEIADAVLFLVNSTNIYGQVITVDGGWTVKNG